MVRFMNGTDHRLRLVRRRAAIAGMLLTGALISSAWSQGPAPILSGKPILSSNWNNADAKLLSAEITRLDALAPGSAAALSSVLGDRAQEVLVTSSDLSPATAARVASVWLSEATEESRAAVVQQALAGSERLSFSGLQSTCEVLKTLEASKAEQAELVTRWLARKELSDLPLAELGWVAPRLLASPLPQANLNVRWTGSVVAPRQGQYTFSVSPIRAQFLQSVYQYAKQTLSVKVDGKEILSFSGAEGSPTALPIELNPDRPAAIEVELNYQSAGVPRDQYPPVAILYWEGPGLPREVVPAASLRTAEGDGQGLLASYSSSETSLQRVDSQISLVAPHGRAIEAQRSPLAQQSLDELWRRATEVSYLDDCAANPATGREHPFLVDAAAATEVMTPAQRQEWLSILSARPGMVDGLGVEQAVAMYRHLRFDGPDEALALLGHWMQVNAGNGSKFTGWFARDNRQIYFDLAAAMTTEYAPHAQRLQDQYLLIEGKRCSLHAAYTLSFAYALQGKLDAWCEFLDERLAEQAGASDEHAAWLVAKAVTEEVKDTDNRYEAPSVFPAWAEPWLARAIRASATPAMKASVFRELIIRHAAARDFASCQQLLAQAEKELGGNLQVATWKQEVEKQQQAHQLDLELQELQRSHQVIKAYEQRLAQARQNNDSSAVTLYEQELGKLRSAASSPGNE